jgi:type I restriction enzyme M protein
MKEGPGAGDGPNGAALFEAANKLGGSVESSEYKHLVLGLLFLKYIFDAFEQRRQALEAELSAAGSDAYVADAAARAEALEDRDEYVAENVFWVPESARWPALLAAASQPDIARRSMMRLARSSRRIRACETCCRASTRVPLSAELMGSLVGTIANWVTTSGWQKR